MNPNLQLLNPYPFARLKSLLGEVRCAEHYDSFIDLSIGEPKHPAPALVKHAIAEHLNQLSHYPPTKGSDELRQVIAHWIAQRYHIPTPDAERQVLPCLGSREALFAFAQAMVNGQSGDRWVVCPNPFYQIYEGAALLAGAKPYYVNADSNRNFAPDWQSVPAEVWQKTDLLFICSPGNPAGNVIDQAQWQQLFALSDQYGFVIASDECYSEIYFEQAPIGALQAAHACGRTDYKNIVSFSSLSKRSNLPGMRSGFVAGDAQLLEQFLLYRTYHGSAMSGVFAKASIAAWQDEAHVRDNRRLYQEKFKAVLPILQPYLDVRLPDASFYLWAGTPYDDESFVRDLYQQCKVTVLPGSYLARTAHGVNPGHQRVRIALVASLEECIEGAQRLADFVKQRID
ncbi:succinyldiaminopimelate transaminase [Brackiella oedipodis]|uniref:succinyldiaminopimelate transaminase n=1 Tax=Brackiella oedipodis TaxID=124225 RepID=UPI00048AB3C6|nr:succinyldiaminopimelate transaminase [Brackiella oedipodis]